MVTTDESKQPVSFQKKLLSGAGADLLGGVQKNVFERTKANLLSQQIELQKRRIELDTDQQKYYDKLNRLLRRSVTSDHRLRILIS